MGCKEKDNSGMSATDGCHHCIPEEERKLGMGKKRNGRERRKDKEKTDPQKFPHGIGGGNTGSTMSTAKTELQSTHSTVKKVRASIFS